MIRALFCILLGAGASADAGVPTSRNLLDQFLSRGSPSAKDQVAKLAKTIDASQPNIEEIALAARHSRPKLCAELRHFVMDAVGRHGDCAYLEALYSLDLDALFGMPVGVGVDTPFWRAIGNPAAVPSETTTRVFSLNYDATIEDALRQVAPYLGLFVWDVDRQGYVYRPGRLFDNVFGEFTDPSEFGKRTGRVPSKNGVFKLHGSVTWFWDGSGRQRYLLPDRAPSGPQPPEVIFGESEKLRITPPYNDLFYAFSQSLSASLALIVIGYSWSDTHINRAIQHEIERGMKVVEVSLFNKDPRATRPFLPDDSIFVRAGARQALLGETVDVACESQAWTATGGGLVGVVRKILHPQISKTENEWAEFRKRKAQRAHG